MLVGSVNGDRQRVIGESNGTAKEHGSGKHRPPARPTLSPEPAKVNANFARLCGLPSEQIRPRSRELPAG